MFVIRHKHFFFSLSLIFMATSIAAIAAFGLNFGVDFTGGTLMEIEYAASAPTKQLLVDELGFYGFGDAVLQQTGERGFVITLPALTEERRLSLTAALDNLGQYTEVRYTSIGPTIGAELRRRGGYAIAAVVLLIIAFIALAFRRVSKPVASWKYGVAAVIALAHDVLIPTGIFAAAGFTIDSLFLTALLAILGLSVSDTIVVFDRIRENLRSDPRGDFEKTVGASLSQTYARSINTSLTTVLVLVSLLVFGGQSTRLFALALTIGMVAGTYSSIFFASPLLVIWYGGKK